MPSENRRIGLTLTEGLERSLKILGLTPDADPEAGVPVPGAIQIVGALARYADAIDHAGRELDKVFSRQEWNYLADVLNGCADVWEWSESPAMPSIAWIAANAEDAHSLDRAGDKWFGEELEPGSGDKATKAMLAKLRGLAPIQGDAILAAIRFFWSHTEIDHSKAKWWLPQFRLRAVERV
jgi:hypothetical protein